MVNFLKQLSFLLFVAFQVIFLLYNFQIWLFNKDTFYWLLFVIERNDFLSLILR